MREEDQEISLSKAMIDVVIRVGRAQGVLKRVMDNDLFDNLSKHNLEWQSEHLREGEMLQSIRVRLSCLLDDVYEVRNILMAERDE